MRVKVGDQWHECQPIMVELADQDKVNIQKMHPDATKYALFDDDDEMSRDEKLAWMEAWME